MTRPARLFLYIIDIPFVTRLFTDKCFLKLKFRLAMGKKLDLKNPETFNEKLQWLKLYDRKSEYTGMVDKYSVREYIAKTVGEEYLIPLLGVWERFEDIDFDCLPEQFVLKCTHDSGGVVVCKNKVELDKESAREKINKSLKKNYFYQSREWPYKNIKPRIIAEKYMEDVSGGLTDYKFMCFNGEVKSCFTCTERFSSGGLKVTFFNEKWEKLPFERGYPASAKEIARPANYAKMLQLSQELSKGIPFVRIDFYEVDGKIYFGELTFYPGSGMEIFRPEQWDYTFGSWIDLPSKN